MTDCMSGNISPATKSLPPHDFHALYYLCCTILRLFLRTRRRSVRTFPYSTLQSSLQVLQCVLYPDLSALYCILQSETAVGVGAAVVLIGSICQLFIRQPLSRRALSPRAIKKSQIVHTLRRLASFNHSSTAREIIQMFTIGKSDEVTTACLVTDNDEQ